MNRTPTATNEELVSLLSTPLTSLSKDVIRNLSIDDLIEAFEADNNAVLHRGLYTFVLEGFEYKATRAAVETAARQAIIQAMEARR